MNLTGPIAQLHQRTVPDNRRQPGGHLGLPPELVNMPVSGQQSFLHRVLRVSWVAQKSQSAPIKRRQAEGHGFFHFENCAVVGRHIHARDTLCGLGLHFTSPFALHDGKMHVSCQIALVKKPASSRNASHLLWSAAHSGALRKIRPWQFGTCAQ
jgi:hypothetical protein